MDRAELLSDFIQRQTVNAQHTEKDGFILCFPNGFRSKNVCEEKLKNGQLKGKGEGRDDWRCMDLINT